LVRSGIKYYGPNCFFTVITHLVKYLLMTNSVMTLNGGILKQLGDGYSYKLL
jgi:hypothetical protein